MYKKVFGIFVLAFLLGNYFKPSFISPDIHIGFSDLAVILIWILAVIFQSKHLIFALKTGSLVIPLTFFVGIATISLLLSGRTYGLTALLVGSLYLSRFIFYSLLFAPVAALINPRQANSLLANLGLSLIFIGLLQYLFVPDIRFLTSSNWDPHYFRVVGTLLDPGFMGILLIFTLLIFTPLSGPLPLFHSFKWAVSYFTFALTYSRSSFLAFISGFTILSLCKKSWRYFFSALLLLTVTVTILPRFPDGEGVKLERLSTIQARLINWENSLIIFKDHFLTGVGFNTYRYAQKSYGYVGGPDWLSSHGGAGADSSILFVAATTGVFGLSVYTWYLFRLWRLSAGHPTFRAGLVALFIHSWFLNSLFYPFVLIWLSIWIVSLKPLGVKSDH